MRGKCATSADRRRAADEAIANLDACQRRAQDLTADLAAEKSARQVDAAAFRLDIRTLKDRMRQGAAPEVEQLEAQLRREIAKREAADDAARKAEGKFEALMLRTLGIIRASGLARSHDEAVSLLVGATVVDGSTRTNPPAGGLVAAAATQRARGVRTIGEIESALDEPLPEGLGVLELIGTAVQP